MVLRQLSSLQYSDLLKLVTITAPFRNKLTVQFDYIFLEKIPPEYNDLYNEHVSNWSLIKWRCVFKFNPYM